MLRGALARIVNLAVEFMIGGAPAFSSLYLQLRFYPPFRYSRLRRCIPY